MANPRRIERLQKQILRTVSSKVLYDMQDPRTATSITFTRVKLTGDMSIAKVYYSVLGTEGDKRTAQKFLDHAKNRIREAVGDGLTTRSVPFLEFYFDPSIEGQIAIAQTLRELEEERAQRGEPKPTDPESAGEEEGAGEGGESASVEPLDPEVAKHLGERAATSGLTGTEPAVPPTDTPATDDEPAPDGEGDTPPPAAAP